MRKLDRTAVAVPPCLTQYRHGAQNWGDVVGEHKQQIRRHLEQMQGRRCAYCEASLDVFGQHIEHFRNKDEFPKLTFAWNNLYWSCDQNDSCGHYKEHGAGTYEIDLIIDPCIDDPDRFFRFRSNGTIDILSELSSQDEERASKTLKVFNLDPTAGRLRWERQKAVAYYAAMVDGCSGFSADELQDFLEAELADAAQKPFFTAIRHVLTKLGP